MNKKTCILIVLFGFMTHTISVTYAKHLFFDLGDVIFHQAYCQGFFFLGPSLIFRYMLNCGSLPQRNHFFDYLMLRYGCDTQSTMPAHFKSWMIEDAFNESFVDDIIRTIHEDHSLKPIEREFFEITAQALKPATMVSLVQPELAALDTLIDCLRYSDKEGNPNILYIVSNWNGYSFDILKEHYPYVFNLFDTSRIIISGKIGFMKPDKRFFEYVINRYQLPSMLSDCIIIDDTLENIASAHSLGFQTIAHKNWYSTRHQLRQKGVFGTLLHP